MRIEKTELLKKVTAAYEHSDFYTLLQLYQQQIGFNADDEKNQTLANGDVLNDYIGILKKQDIELRDKIGAIRWEAEMRKMGFITHEKAWDLLGHFILQEQSHYIAQINNSKNDIETFADVAMYKKVLGTIQMYQLRPAGNFSFAGEDIYGPDDEIFDEFFAETIMMKKYKKSRKNKKY